MISTDCGQLAIEKAEFQPGTKVVAIKKNFQEKVPEVAQYQTKIS